DPHDGRTSRGSFRRHTCALRRRPSAGRSRTGPWGTYRPWSSTTASCRHRGRRQLRRRPAWQGVRSRTGSCGCRMSRCRWWLRRTESLDPPLGPPYLLNQPCIVVVHVLFFRWRTACGGAPGAVWLCAPLPHEKSGPSHVVEEPPTRVERLSAQTEALDQLAVTSDVGVLQVAQHALATADQQQQTAAAVVVVLVLTRMLGEVQDATGEHRDLDLGGTGVALFGAVLGHDLLLDSSVQGHAVLLGLVVARCLGAGSPRLSVSAAGCTAGSRLPAVQAPPL